jgi:threonine/homoserine/homoserine lactone efflux protein
MSSSTHLISGPLSASLLLLLAAAITPGPNNLVMLQIGREHGMRAAFAPATGVVLGGLAMLLAVHAGVAAVFAAHPLLRPLVAGSGAILVAWLGLRLVWSSRACAPARAESPAATAGGVAGMILFQFANPKAWLLVLTVTATAAGVHTAAVSLTTLLLLFIVVPYGCLALWAGGGSLAARLLHDGKARARFDRANGILLAASALLILWQP